MSAEASKPASSPHAALAELSRIVLNGQSLIATLQRVAEIAKQVVPDVADVSVTVIERGKPQTVAFTGPLAADLDERQYQSGFGPCLDAAETGETVVIDTRRSELYPLFCQVALRQRVNHVVSVGLPIPQQTVGGLNFYSRAEEAIDEEALGLLTLFAGYAAVAVFNATVLHGTVKQVRQMQGALESRATIEQAKGILMAQWHCSSEDAFESLVRTSQRRNVKLREVAAEIVDSAKNDL